MTASRALFRTGLALTMLALVALIGCSSSDPISSTARTTAVDEQATGGIGGLGDEGAMTIDAMITRVNLASNTLNLSDVSGDLAIDENTSIYLLKPAGRESNPGAQGSGDYIRVPGTINDLNRGDTVRVQADPINGQMMQAVSVTVEGEFSDPWFDIQFTDRLASVDTATFEVTFESNSFGGTVFVCAVLNDAEGNWIWLQDFSAGELVDVAGRWEEEVFVIYQMIKVAE